MAGDCRVQIFQADGLTPMVGSGKDGLEGVKLSLAHLSALPPIL
jgi:hypothetical protein